MNGNLILLALCQGLFLTNNVTLMAANGLVGLSLAPVPWMSTLPVAGYVAGGALAAPIVARHQRAWGRKRGFQIGLIIAMVASSICALAVVWSQFWLLCAATVLAGYYSANASLYRFAGVDLVSPSMKERAISWVLAGGLLGAVVGPNLSISARGWLHQPFAGAYLALVAVAAVGLIVVSCIEFPPISKVGANTSRPPLRAIVRRPVFIVAAASCAIGYGVMNLVMAATPIAMTMCSHPFASIAWVLEWHVVGMYGPSFFTGALIRRYGASRIIAIGIALNLVCVAIAVSGVDLVHFMAALITLGVGWNFIYIGGTSLATEAYSATERTTAQAAIDFCVYATMTLTAFGSGVLVTVGGWQAMNYGTLLPMAALSAALMWLSNLKKRSMQQAAV